MMKATADFRQSVPALGDHDRREVASACVSVLDGRMEALICAHIRFRPSNTLLERLDMHRIEIQYDHYRIISIIE